MLTVLFSRRRNLGSCLIRAVTWSQWSHVDLVLPGGVLLGATVSKGVGYDMMDYRLSHASAAALVHLPADFDKAIAWAQTQVGRGYDWFGAAGLALHRDWEEEDLWWCSEYIGKASKEGGFLPYDTGYIRRLTPEHLWMLDCPREFIKT